MEPTGRNPCCFIAQRYDSLPLPSHRPPYLAARMIGRKMLLSSSWMLVRLNNSTQPAAASPTDRYALHFIVHAISSGRLDCTGAKLEYHGGIDALTTPGSAVFAKASIGDQ